jgi:hypothetical protein
MPSQRDTIPNLRNLIQSKETVIIQYILNLNAQGFPPQIATVADRLILYVLSVT